jgi:hypothetical protein
MRKNIDFLYLHVNKALGCFLVQQIGFLVEVHFHNLNANGHLPCAEKDQPPIPPNLTLIL